jgi:hypothetical protein
MLSTRLEIANKSNLVFSIVCSLFAFFIPYFIDQVFLSMPCHLQKNSFILEFGNVPSL